MRRRNVIKYSSLTSLLDVLFILMFASLAQAAALVEKARDQAKQSEQRSQANPSNIKAGASDAGTATVADAGIADGAVAAPSLATDAGTAPGTPKNQLHDRAIAQLRQALLKRRPIYVRITVDGMLRALEYREAGKQKQLKLVMLLVKRDPDPDREWQYLAEVDPAMRICAIVRKQLKLADLRNELIIIAPDVPFTKLNDALHEGLKREPNHCEINGMVAYVNLAQRKKATQ